MLRTQHNVSLEINDKKFELVYTQPPREVAEKLAHGFMEDRKKVDRVIGLQESIQELEGNIDINKGLLEYAEGDEKLKLLKESKNWMKQLARQRGELKEAGSEKTSIEENYKEAFLHAISGKGKEALSATIAELDLSYTMVMQEIDKLVLKAVKGK